MDNIRKTDAEMKEFIRLQVNIDLTMSNRNKDTDERLTASLSERIEYLLPGTVDLDPTGTIPVGPLTLRDLPVGSVPVARLLEHLKTGVLDGPKRLTVSGTFYSAVLLSSGWWQQPIRTTPVDVAWQGKGLQRWLYYGFTEWAPSWDISSMVEADNPCLFGQIGTHDEADSIPVVVPPEKASRIRDRLNDKLTHGQPITFEAEVTGTLYGRNHLPTVDKLWIPGRWKEVPEYFIILDADDPQDDISPQDVASSFYSGYLWKCLGPKDWSQGSPGLEDVYFVWEHTDFNSQEAIKFNLDSLNYKVDRLLSQLKSDEGTAAPELVLLQKSSPIVDGDPYIATEAFYNFVTRGRAARSG